MAKFSKVYYGIICENCGPVQISKENYVNQLDRPDALWVCPSCGENAIFDDIRHERSMNQADDRKPKRKNKWDSLKPEKFSDDEY